MSDATLIDESPELAAETPSEEALAPAAEPAQASPEAAAPVDDDLPKCEKCSKPSDAAACPYCGWYPSLGIHVEIDAEFEAVMTGQSPAGEEADAEPTAEAKPEWQKHLEVWNGLIPLWAWLMIGTSGAAVGAGIASRILTQHNPTLHMYCGVGGLLLGIAIFAIAHLVTFVICSFDDASFGVFDLIIKPLKTWKKIFSQLPTRLWLANSGNLGLSVALSSALIVGGIPYEKLLDWGFKKRAKPNLLAMVAEQASKAKGKGSDSLEDAVDDLAGKADGLETEAPAKPKPVVRKKLECLIIGYQTDRDGILKSVLLATDIKGKLKYAGRVKPILTPVEAIELVEKLQKNSSTRPFVKTPDVGKWVRPRFTCRITYGRWPEGGRPKDLEWDELMAEMKLPW